MDQELIKSLTNLIDETIAEIEDLKKSQDFEKSRFSAAEAQLGQKDSGIKGQDKDGKIKKEDEDDEDEEEADEAEKAEGCNRQADPSPAGVTEPDKGKVPPKSNLEEEAHKAEGKNSEADPGKRGVVEPSLPSDPPKSSLHAEAAKAEDEDEKKKKEKKDEEAKKAELPPEGYHIKKSLEEQETLMKSYVDEKVSGLEKKLESILSLVKEIGDQPVPRKGVPAGAVPLHKSAEESLSKTQVIDKLLELKKSGKEVDSADIAMVEIGGSFQSVIEKYSLN
jgi:hypothetical protein